MTVDGHISLTLTPDEVCVAAFHGLMRRIAKINGLRRDRAQNEASTWENEMEGACAEFAYCKLHGVYPTGISEMRATDAGKHGEVRWTRHYDTGHLIIYRTDKDRARFVLMDGFAPMYRVIGWLIGGDGKQDQWFDSKGGYYMVPRSELRSPLEE